MKVFIIEDDSVTRMILNRLLLTWGFEVTAFESAEQAQNHFAASDLDHPIGIVDWNLPGISGIEFCQWLRDQGHGNWIYLIVVSAREGVDHLSQALESGADDYVFKPFNPNELKSRIHVAQRAVEAFIKIREISAENAKKAESLAQEIEQQAKLLVQKDRLSVLGTLVAGIAHEVNNPIMFLKGNLELLKRYQHIFIQALERYQSQASSADKTVAKTFAEDFPEILQAMDDGVLRVTTLVQDLKLYSSRKVEESLVGDLAEVVKSAIKLTRQTRGKGIDWLINVLPENMLFDGNALQIEQIIVNLLVNAIDAIETHPNKSLEISAIETEESYRLTVRDYGPGIPEHIEKSLWDPFFTTKPPNKGTGLGLAISRQIAENHGGELQYEPAVPGAAFHLTLPKGGNIVRKTFNRG